MRYVGCSILILLTVATAACSEVTAPTNHDTCSGGSAEWDKCMTTSFHR